MSVINGLATNYSQSDRQLLPLYRYNGDEDLTESHKNQYHVPSTYFDHCQVWTEPMRGGSVGTSVRGPVSQEEARESLKGPIALAINDLF